MSAKKASIKTRSLRRVDRTYESEAAQLQPMRLVEAPEPLIEVTHEQITAHFKKYQCTVAMIHQIIKTVRSL
jgi:hypothetical protein